jgi:hypothetical protein
MDDDAPSPEPHELPRLHIIHLLAWTAATALAFVPYRVQQEQLSQTSATAGSPANSSAATAMNAGSGVVNGAYLFVALAVLWWRRRGYAVRLQPGHYLAFEGTAQWAVLAVAWALFGTVRDSKPAAYALVAIPVLLVGLIFWVWFLRLAFRRGESTLWRWAFGVIALGPVVQFGSIFVLTFVRATRGGTLFSSVATSFFIFGGGAMLKSGLLAAAIVDDVRSRRDRHWSHWVGAGARLALTLGMLALYAVSWALMPAS